MALLEKIMKHSPDFILETLLRRSLQPPTQNSKDEIEMGVATDPDDVLACYELIYEVYQQSGLCEAEEENIRLTKHALLPTTSLIYYKINGEVVATISIICDNPFGFPLESLWSVNDLRSEGHRIAEISTLAIKKGYRRQRGIILLPFTAFLFQYAYEFLGVDYLVIAIHPRARIFYKAIFNFQPISKEVKSYNSVKNAPAFGMQVRLSSANEFTRHIRKYKVGKGQGKRTIYDILFSKDYSSFKFPERRYYRAFDPSFKLNLLKKVFSRSIHSLKKLELWERQLLCGIFFDKSFRPVFVTENVIPFPKFTQRNHQRYPVYCPVKILSEDHRTSIDGRLLDISSMGVQLFTPQQSLEANFKGSLHVKLSPHEEVVLEVQGRRLHNSRVGLEILSINDSEKWQNFLDYLDETLNADSPQKPSSLSVSLDDLEKEKKRA
ncbi:MAG: PilZ domain-containing protein [Bdellovibrionales bacterium]|nr:PilZ domain-containing protein [Bdellovibrionales bacterium]